MLLDLAIVITVGALAGITAGALVGVAKGFVQGARYIARGSGWLERQRTERVIVHTTDGQTFEGNVLEVGRDGVVLTAVVMVDHGVNVAGDVWIPRPKVLMVQRRPLEG